uniref:non-specific serine/threonine protein kinase n=1 Tax=Lactuca sativa TaxID=4236 RepID=A0A9R1WCM5_LACSA|nr:hypothetical protein LSAT_V11C200056710 [Lactuca sativa]
MKIFFSNNFFVFCEQLTNFGLSKVGLINSTNDLFGPTVSGTSLLGDNGTQSSLSSSSPSPSLSTTGTQQERRKNRSAVGQLQTIWHPRFFWEMDMSTLRWGWGSTFTSLLLTEDPNQRLGARGATEVKQHPYFRDINWDTLARKKGSKTCNISGHLKSRGYSGGLRSSEICTPEMKTSYDCENPKESESPRFQAILWEVLSMIQGKFDKEKEEVDADLHIFAGDLLGNLEKNAQSQPQWQETLEDLLVLAQSCAMTSPGEFWLQCEGIVQELDDRHQELPMADKRIPPRPSKPPSSSSSRKSFSQEQHGMLEPKKEKPILKAHPPCHMNELADIARCAGNTSLDDDQWQSYSGGSCPNNKKKIIKKEKYLQMCEMVDDEKVDIANTVIDEDAPLEDDVVRSLRTSPIHFGNKDRTSIDDFEIIKPISRGAFGRVFLAKKRTTGDLFSIKVLKKADMIRKNAVESILAERDILISILNPFVVRFFYSLTCRENLYLVMEYLNGGDLYSLLRNLGCLDEDVARIYIAEVVLALEYLHSLCVVHFPVIVALTAPFDKQPEVDVSDEEFLQFDTTAIPVIVTLNKGTANIKVAGTDMNNKSSWSHSVFTCWFSKRSSIAINQLKFRSPMA